MTPQKGTKETKDTIWISHSRADDRYLASLTVKDLAYEVMPSEEAVGRAMLNEITRTAAAKDGPIVMVLVGGSGGQALHRLLGAMAKTSDHDDLFSRLDVFTQDALAPLRVDSKSRPLAASSSKRPLVDTAKRFRELALIADLRFECLLWLTY